MKIGEMAQRTDLPESTLRYYEKKGLLKVARDSGGRRDYEESDIAWIRFIRRLKETGMLLKDIKQYSELRYRGQSTMPKRLEILLQHREYVEEQYRKWQEYLQNLDDKIVFYQQSIESRQSPEQNKK